MFGVFFWACFWGCVILISIALIREIIYNCANSESNEDEENMSNFYDNEREAMIAYAKSSKNMYSGPAEQISIIEVLFDEKTRKCQIIYNLRKGKRTIDKRFTQDGIQYKIYSDWQYTNTEKTKRITLTNNAIQNLPQTAKDDNIIKIALTSIYKALPEHLQPMDFKISQIEEKYAQIKKDREKKVFNSYNICSLIVEKDLLRMKEDKLNKELSQEISSYSNYTSQTNNYLIILDKHGKSFFKWFYYLSDCMKKAIIKKNKAAMAKMEPAISNKKEADMILIKEIEALTKEIDTLTQKRNNELQKIDHEISMHIEEELKKLKEAKVVEPQLTLKPGMPSEDWIREERNKMGRIYKDGLTLRNYILKRDNHTCKKCGNSITKEPNLLLEVDHIHPVSKWGPSVPENLETLCWKCNRNKSDKEN